MKRQYLMLRITFVQDMYISVLPRPLWLSAPLSFCSGRLMGRQAFIYGVYTCTYCTVCIGHASLRTHASLGYAHTYNVSCV